MLRSLLMISALMCTACSENAPKTTGPSVPARPTRLTPAKPAPLVFKTETPTPNPAFLNLLKNTAANCSFTDSPRPERCPKGESTKLGAMLTSMGATSLPTLTFAASSPDKRLRNLSAWLLQNRFDPLWLERRTDPTIDPKTVLRLRELVIRSDVETATRLTRIATWVQGIDGDVVGWLESLEKHPSRAVRADAHRHSMRFGGLKPFPLLTKVALGGGGDKLLRQAAMRAPLEVASWSPEFQAQVCPWARDNLRLKESMLAAWPPKMLARCPDAFISTMHKEVAHRLEAKTLKRPMIEGLVETCAAPERRKASPKMCDRSRRLLTEIAKADAIPARSRAHALLALGRQWPDEQTSQLAKTLSKLPAPHLKHTGRKVQEHIERVRFGAPAPKKRGAKVVPTGSAPVKKATKTK